MREDRTEATSRVELEAFLSRVDQHETARWIRLVRRHMPAQLSALLEPEDVLHDAVVHVLEAPSKFGGPLQQTTTKRESQFRCWFRAVLIQRIAVLAAFYGRVKRTTLLKGAGGGKEGRLNTVAIADRSYQRLENEETFQQIANELRQLSLSDLELMLITLQHGTAKDVAKAQGTSVASVYARASRIRTRFREVVERLDGS